MKKLAPRLKNWIGRNLVLNLFAVIGALLGLANAALAWLVFGVGIDADVWMMTLVVIQAFILLSQLGVEQVAVYSAEAHARDPQQGVLFDRDSLTWSMVFGLLFASIAFWLLDYIIHVFAPGYSLQTKAQLSSTLQPLLLQVALAPSQYVLRQQLLLKGRARTAILLNSSFSAVQCACLTWIWMIGQSNPFLLSWTIALSSVGISFYFLLLVGERGVGQHVPNWPSLWPFVRASVQLRAIHSVHNFIVVLLTNAALSGGIPGTVAIFQYFKKLADGLSSISVGPHLVVYHAAQARAWVANDRLEFQKNIRLYLKAALPLFLVSSIAFAVVAEFSMKYFAVRNFQLASPEGLLLLLLLVWQTVISLESIAAGVLVLSKNSGLILIVNLIYVGLFFVAINVIIQPPYTGATVAIASLGCQLVSFVLFGWLAVKIYRHKFISHCNA